MKSIAYKEFVKIYGKEPTINELDQYLATRRDFKIAEDGKIAKYRKNELRITDQ